MAMPTTTPQVAMARPMAVQAPVSGLPQAAALPIAAATPIAQQAPLVVTGRPPVSGGAVNVAPTLQKSVSFVSPHPATTLQHTASGGSPQAAPKRALSRGQARTISHEVVDSAQAPGEIMEIQVPEGVEPGQIISITVPDGRQATLKLPEGFAPGSTLTLFFDSVAGTLSTLDRSSAQSAPAEHSPVDPSATVLVQVPAGVGGGQLIAVTVPSGRQVNFKLPAGAREGQTLRLWFDPISSTLMHMP